MTDAVRDEVLKVIRDQEAANARSDAAGVMMAYAEDSVSYELPPPLEHRGDAARGTDNLERWFATWDGEVSVELADPTVVVEGDLAVVFGLNRMRGVQKSGRQVDNWNRRTVVLRRQAGTWRIIHDHSSYPMKMDGSGKAATDLKP